jgi:hypothetical protein
LKTTSPAAEAAPFQSKIEVGHSGYRGKKQVLRFAQDDKFVKGCAYTLKAMGKFYLTP